MRVRTPVGEPQPLLLPRSGCDSGCLAPDLLTNGLPCAYSCPVTERTLQVDLWFLQLLRKYGGTAQSLTIGQ